MSGQGFGREVPPAHAQREHRAPVRYVVVIASGADRIARLLLDSREQVAEYDAGAAEVTDLIQGAPFSVGATGAEWDRALSAHGRDERAQAVVYALDI